MGSAFNWTRELGPAGLVLGTTAGVLAGVGLLVAFILLRRTYRRRYFRRRDARTFAIRQQWKEIISGAVPPETWRFDRMDREIVETILLNSMEDAALEIPALLRLLRLSGLLDLRIYEAQVSRGWRRQGALVSLGRMRAPEAIPALTEALDDTDPQTRAAAVRGLGRTGLLEAARQILERVVAGGLRMPAAPVQIALVNCCRSQPELLLPYLHRAAGETRELLSRVLAELATPDMGDDLLLLAGDPLAEVRASTARALGEAKPGLALQVLNALARDPEWFVRLRAVAALGVLEDPRAIPALLETLCDANRYVRLRAAASLVRLDLHLEEILVRVVETRDSYALQSLVSELERSGQLRQLVDRLSDRARLDNGAEFLLDAVRAGSRDLRNTTAALKSQKVSS